MPHYTNCNLFGPAHIISLTPITNKDELNYHFTHNNGWRSAGRTGRQDPKNIINYFRLCLAITATQTCFAPASRSAFAANLIVAPVVMTSSTIK